MSNLYHIGKVLLCALFCISLTGCDERIAEDRKEIKACVASEYYKPRRTYTQVIKVGKSFVPQTRISPARHEITLGYNNKFYEIDNEKIYNLYSSKLYEKVDCTLITYKYESGKTKDLIEIDGQLTRYGKQGD